MAIDRWLEMLDDDYQNNFYFEIDSHAAGKLAADIRKLMAHNERLKKALDFYHCGCAEGTCNVTRPKFKGIRCGMTARKALEGKDD